MSEETKGALKELTAEQRKSLMETCEWFRDILEAAAQIFADALIRDSGLTNSQAVSCAAHELVLSGACGAVTLAVREGRVPDKGKWDACGSWAFDVAIKEKAP